MTRTRYDRDEVVLPMIVRDRAETIGDRPFLRDVTGGSLTYRELHERSLLWARALMRCGVEPGSTVVTMLHNTVENYAVWFGIAWAGAIEVPINVDLRGSVLAHQLNVAAADLIIADPSAITAIAESAPAVPTLRRVIEITDEEPEESAGRLLRLHRASVLTGLADAPSRPYADLQVWDIASVLYTSGTTGPSKGVLMPWAQLHAGQLLTAAAVSDGPSPNKVMYVTGPPNHVQAKGAVAVMAMLGGTALASARIQRESLLGRGRRTRRHRCRPDRVDGAVPARRAAPA